VEATRPTCFNSFYDVFKDPLEQERCPHVRRLGQFNPSRSFKDEPKHCESGRMNFGTCTVNSGLIESCKNISRCLNPQKILPADLFLVIMMSKAKSTELLFEPAGSLSIVMPLFICVIATKS
jgi:hypothetical protein